MKLSKRSFIVGLVALSAVLLLIGTVSAAGPGNTEAVAGQRVLFGPTMAAAVTPIPWTGSTDLPEYIGAPAKPHPLPPANVPQNPFLAPNQFNYVHNDPWMSDTYEVAGPLGRNPRIWSSTLAAARAYSD